MATNLLVNSSFEVGSTTNGTTTYCSNWVGSGNLGAGFVISIESDGTAVDGARYQRIKLDTPTATGKNIGLVSDKVTGITPGNTYSVSAAARSIVTMIGCTASISIYWYKSDDTYISVSSTTFTPSNSWKRQSLTATAPALSAKAAIYVSIQSIDTGDTGWVDFDAVKFEESATATTYADADEIAAKLADFSTGLAAIFSSAKKTESSFVNQVRATDGPWTRQGVILQATEAWEIAGAANACEVTVIKEGDVWKMWYHGGTNPYCVGYATSTSPLGPWTKYASNPVLSNARYPHVLKVDNTYHLFCDQSGSINHYTSTNGTSWSASGTNLIPQGPAGTFDSAAVANMHAWVEGSTWFMLYEAKKTGETWYTIGLATASNPAGPWTKHAQNPLLGSPVMCASHPWLLKRNGLYHLFFHGGNAGALPTDAMRATGTTPYQFTVDAWPLLRRATADEGQNTNIGQIGDICVVEDTGVLYMYYTACADGTIGPWYVKLATAPITNVGSINDFLQADVVYDKTAKTITWKNKDTGAVLLTKTDSTVDNVETVG